MRKREDGGAAKANHINMNSILYLITKQFIEHWKIINKYSQELTNWLDA